ncbi:hypothetical protein WKW50_16530 [Ochrobactrum sp. GPK 3]
MALSDYVVETREIAVPKASPLSVRGLSLVDVTRLLSTRGKEIQTFFQKYISEIQAGGNPKADLPANLGQTLLDSAPSLVAEIIAHAADEPQAVHQASRLPITTQLEALEAIGQLTFDAEGGPKKFLEAVIRIMSGATGMMSGLNQSQIGSLVSAGK